MCGCRAIIVDVLLWAALLTGAVADYTVTLRLVSYTNPTGQVAGGTCCDLLFLTSCNCLFCLPYAHCDYSMRACVEPTDGGSSSADQCTTAWMAEGPLSTNADSVTFGADSSDWNPFTTAALGGDFLGVNVKLVIFDRDVFTTELVDRISMQFDSSNYTMNQWYNASVVSQRTHAVDTRMELQFRVDYKNATPHDCAGWRKMGFRADRPYLIDVNGTELTVFCDMSTDGGGWTLVQRRVNGSQSFEQHWREYVNGFGATAGSYWLGLDNIYTMAALAPQKLQIELTDCHDITKRQTYNSFRLEDASDNYRLRVSESSTGDAGDSLNSANAFYKQNGMEFSSTDADHDHSTNNNCALYHTGAYWFNACAISNMNGKYYPDCHYTTTSPVPDGILWMTWRTGYYSAKYAAMKIRPADFRLP